MVSHVIAISRNASTHDRHCRSISCGSYCMRKIILAPIRGRGRNADCSNVTTLPSAGPSLFSRALVKTQ